VAMKVWRSDESGLAGEQPTRVTTIAAEAEPRLTLSCNDKPVANPVTKPPMKASPAPVGFSAVTR